MKKRTATSKRPKPIAETVLRSSAKPYYLRVRLWRTKEELAQDSRLVGTGPVGPAVAIFTTDARTAKSDSPEIVKNEIGTIDFVQGLWWSNTVTHELQHALHVRMMTIGPTVEEAWGELELEEELAYEIGDWAGQLYKWLWANCPSKKHIVELVPSILDEL